jgi:hypothetical protein
MGNLLYSYAIAFVATIVIEVAVAALLGYRRRTEIAAVICVNLFTHPLVNYLVWLIVALRSAPVGPRDIALFEISIVIIEWLLLCYAIPNGGRTRLFVLSLAINGASYLAGLLLRL